MLLLPFPSFTGCLHTLAYGLFLHPQNQQYTIFISCSLWLSSASVITSPFTVTLLPPCFKVAATKSLQSCPTLSDPMDWSLPGSSIHGNFQARVLEWGAIAFLGFIIFRAIVVQSLSHVQHFVTPWIAIQQVSLSSFSQFALMMALNHIILCFLLLLPPSIFPRIRLFSNELALLIKWPKYCGFRLYISPANEYSVSISFRID